MSMVSRFILVLFIATLVGCAQVGTITGGGKDIAAPQPVVEKVSPPHASTSIGPEQIIIPFDEFIKLNNPTQNIKITPATLTATTKIKKKSLIIDLEGKYLDNTTYSIAFNRAVKDITEGNDSLFYFVFSTGNYIDSLNAKFMVKDAFTNKPVENATVGLYKLELNKTTDTAAVYLTSSHKDGSAAFNYLKEESYFVYAFIDANKNGRLDEGESSGRLKENYLISQLNDSILPVLFISEQEQQQKITTEYEEPGKLKVAFGKPVNKNKLKFLTPKPVYYQWNKTEDSVFLHYSITSSSKVKFVFDKDTISKRIATIDPVSLKAQSNLIKNKIPLGKDLTLTFNDVVLQYGYQNILLNGESMVLQKGKILAVPNSTKIEITFDSTKDTNEVVILPNTLKFANLKQEDTLRYSFTNQTKKDVGNLVVVADSVFPQGIVQLILNEKVVRSSKVDAGESKISFNELQPNEYGYRFVYDTNLDGKWSPGNVYENTEAERIVWFADRSKVRANWDVEATLKF